MRRIILFLVISLIASMLFACAPKPVTEPVAPETPKPVSQVDKAGWEVEWEKTLEAAKKEGRFVIYGGTISELVKEPEVANLFKQRYGLTPLVTFGRGGDLLAKLRAERGAGLFMADIVILGTNNTIGEFKPAGVLDPLEPSLILPEVKDPRGWFGGKLPWADADRTAFNMLAYPVSDIGVNTGLAKPEEIKSYYDLLAPKWKGKIVMNDPTISGIAFNAFSTLILHKILDLDFFRQLIKQQPTLLRDQHLQVDWLARGKYSVALWPQSFRFFEYKDEGAPIVHTPNPKEGTYVSSGGSSVSLFNRAPHPNAAKVFINWMFSREGQGYLQKHRRQQSARVDIPTEGVDPQNIRETGVKYFRGANTLEEWLVKEQNRYLEIAKQVFEPLLK